MKATLLLLCLTLISCSKLDPLKATVMITNLAANSGGSGTIMKSADEGSLVLTNGHVCDVAKQGGIVHTEDGTKALIVSYKKSRAHDLCLILVRENLRARAVLAPGPPAVLDNTTILGHPHLLPVISTKGQFSHKLIIRVMVGMRACTDAEYRDPEVGAFCILVGSLPIIKTYEAQAVSALIQPGSSGSAIYDSSNHITGVVFAGNSDLGFGLAVPYEYVSYFLNVELSRLPMLKPNAEVMFADSGEQKNWNKDLKNACDTPASPKVTEICRVVENLLILN